MRGNLHFQFHRRGCLWKKKKQQRERGEAFHGRKKCEHSSETITISRWSYLKGWKCEFSCSLLSLFLVFVSLHSEFPSLIEKVNRFFHKKREFKYSQFTLNKFNLKLIINCKMNFLPVFYSVSPGAVSRFWWKKTQLSP